LTEGGGASLAQAGGAGRRARARVEHGRRRGACRRRARRRALHRRRLLVVLCERPDRGLLSAEEGGGSTYLPRLAPVH
jgi:hypothetical protein